MVSRLKLQVFQKVKEQVYSRHLTTTKHAVLADLAVTIILGMDKFQMNKTSVTEVSHLMKCLEWGKHLHIFWHHLSEIWKGIYKQTTSNGAFGHVKWEQMRVRIITVQDLPHKEKTGKWNWYKKYPVHGYFFGWLHRLKMKSLTGSGGVKLWRNKCQFGKRKHTPTIHPPTHARVHTYTHMLIYTIGKNVFQNSLTIFRNGV